MRQPRKWVETVERRLSGDWIRWRRTRAGLSLRQLGARVECSAVYLSDIERGQRSASVRISERLNEVLS